MKKFREYLEDVYVEVNTDEINEFDFEPYKDMLAEEEPDMVETLKAHIIVKRKLEDAGIETGGGAVGEVNPDDDIQVVLDSYKEVDLEEDEKEEFMVGLLSHIATGYIIDLLYERVGKADGETKRKLMYYADKFAETTHGDRCNYMKHIPVEQGGFKVEMKVQTVQDLLKESEHLMESDIYNYYDLKEDGTKIVNVYSMGEEGGIAGVEYEDGTFGIVGCKTDEMVETKEEMIKIVEQSI